MTNHIGDGSEHGVDALTTCLLTVTTARWPFAEDNADAIDAHWARRRATSPAMFNGTIFVLGSSTREGGSLTGSLLQTDFKSFLYWKDHGYPDPGVRDVFGSALIRSAEGHIVLGRQAAGNLNAGLAYLPGGFIDRRDVDEQGRVALEASVAREVLEETGLSADHLAREPGMLLTRAGAMHSIAVPFRSPLDSSALKARIEAHIATQTDPELAEVVVVRGAQDLAAVQMPLYASVLLAHLLAKQ